MKRKKKKRSTPGEGVYCQFHGAFGTEAKAQDRAKKRRGWVIKRFIRGQRRYIVLGERVPF